MIRKLLLGSVFALAAASFTVSAYAEEKKEEKKAEMKCDKAGKECKDGADCKAENCKKEKK